MFKRRPSRRPEVAVAEQVYRRLDILSDAEAIEYADLMLSQAGRTLARTRHGDEDARKDMEQFGDVIYALLHRIAGRERPQSQTGGVG